eukprot:1136860-Pelagomonas_calceolata.AAC.2
MGIWFMSKFSGTVVVKSQLLELVKGMLSITSPANTQKDVAPPGTQKWKTRCYENLVLKGSYFQACSSAQPQKLASHFLQSICKADNFILALGYENKRLIGSPPPSTESPLHFSSTFQNSRAHDAVKFLAVKSSPWGE